MKKKLRLVPFESPVLRKESDDIKKIDSEIKELIKLMYESLDRFGGIGLAAPQIGINKKLAVINLAPGGHDISLTVINPKIMSRSKYSTPYVEGCLSVPGVNGNVIRPARIKLKYINAEGEEKTARFGDLTARVAQHEIDHLLGTLFIEKLSEEEKEKNREGLKKLYKKLEKTKKKNR